MRKYIYTIVLLLGSMALFAQTTRSSVNSRVEDESSNLLKATLPDVIPPSPDAFSFKKYGKNTVNEYKGKLNNSIPLYTYAAGQLSTSVSLGYSGAGVKVEDMATWVGINWNLTAGGVITRQIKDGADEGVLERPMINEAHLKINADSLCAPDSQYYWGMADNNESFNTEVDIFNFSFDGYSGAFYLDGNFNPVYLQNENELKIEILGTGVTNKDKFRNDYSFMITAPNGVKYYFGGTGYLENTRVLSGGHSMDTDGVTSFYLSKVEHPVNGTLLFEYDTVGMRSQHLSKSYNMTAALAGYGENVPGTFTESIFSTRINDLKRLKKIKSLNNSIEVVFNRTDYSNNPNFTSVLNSIEVRRITIAPNYELLKKIDFTYGAKVSPSGPENDFQNASRFFLTKLEIDKDLDTEGNESEVYSFVYDNPYALPPRIKSPNNPEFDKADSRDYAGYFNDRDNRSLIANDPRYNFGSIEGFGNLTPDFTHGKKGSLIKIIYPTKGYSVFEYEAIPAKKPVHKSYGFQINSYADNVFDYPQLIEIPGYSTGIGQEEPSFIPSPTVYKDQTIRFIIETHTPPHTNSQMMQNKGVEFIIQDITDPQNIITTTFTQLYQNSEPDRFFDLKKDHEYTFRFQFKDNYSSGDYGILEASLSFNIFEGYVPIDGVGIRLKKEINYDSDATQTHYKRYYYGAINGEYNDVAQYLDISTVYPKTSFSYAVGNEQQALVMATFSSDFLNKYNAIMEDQENFPVVSISLGGDNFEKGGIEKNFLHARNTDVKRLYTIHDGCWFSPSQNQNVCGSPQQESQTLMHFVVDSFLTYQKNEQTYFNGKLLSERSYVKKNGALFKIKEQETLYTIEKDFSKKITNFVGNQIISNYNTGQNFCPGNPTEFLNGLYGYYFGYYYTYVFNQKLNKIITTDYIDPVPMSSYIKYNFNKQLDFTFDNPDLILEDPEGYIPQDILENNFKKIISTQSYEYGALRGMPTKVTTTNSDGTVQHSESVYVNQYGTLTGLTSGQTAAYAALLAQNNVGSPIETKQSDTSGTLGKKRTTYQILTGNKVVPELIQTAKGTLDLEDRAVFEEYDSKGNPTLMSLQGGVKIKYLYNANNQVIAKIENFSGTLDPNTNSIANACTFIGQYPNAQVSVFEYHPVTNLLVTMYDPNCKKTTYVYDALHRLQQIKDNDGNVIKEFDTNFKH